MKRVYLIGLLTFTLSTLVACGTTTGSRGYQSDQQQISEITLKKGKEERKYNLSSDKKDIDEVLAQLEDHGVNLSTKDYLCEGSKETDWRLMRLVELKTEMSILIDTLNKREKPRVLKPAEKYMLSQVQACRPFLVSLKTVVGLLNGNDIKSVKYTQR